MFNKEANIIMAIKILIVSEDTMCCCNNKIKNCLSTLLPHINHARIIQAACANVS